MALRLRNMLMRAISHAPPIVAPIQAANIQAANIQTANKPPYAPKPVAESMPTQPLKAQSQTGVWENKSFSFWDILDAINPLQHIPIISTIYRKITGDEMGYAARIAGDTLYGGLFGSLISSLVSAVANVFVDSTTGKDIGEHMMASITPAQTQSPAAAAPQVIDSTMNSNIEPTSDAAIKQITMAKKTANQQQIISPLISSPTTATTEQLTPPPIDPARLQAGIDQYKWQIMADEIKTRSSRWA